MLTIRKDQMNAMVAAAGVPATVPCVRSWVEFQLFDDKGKPVPKAKYKVKIPDGSILDGTLNEEGVVRVDNIDPGQCQITFTEFEGEQWEPLARSGT